MSPLITSAYYISFGFSQVIRSIGFQSGNVSISTFEKAYDSVNIHIELLTIKAPAKMLVKRRLLKLSTSK